MAGLIQMRLTRPDRRVVVDGPLSADLRAWAEKETGQPWWLLEAAGWRIEPVPEVVS